jgi:alpha-galactosidase
MIKHFRRLGLSVGQVATAAVTPGDGLALTPPMGFNNWNSTNCRAEFNETMVKGIADIFVANGLKDAGYQYVNLDDCWALSQRNAAGDLVPDPVRFPNGIKAVADYVHSKGLKFGGRRWLGGSRFAARGSGERARCPVR